MSPIQGYLTIHWPSRTRCSAPFSLKCPRPPSPNTGTPANQYTLRTAHIPCREIPSEIEGCFSTHIPPNEPEPSIPTPSACPTGFGHGTLVNIASAALHQPITPLVDPDITASFPPDSSCCPLLSSAASATDKSCPHLSGISAIAHGSSLQTISLNTPYIESQNDHETHELFECLCSPPFSSSPAPITLTLILLNACSLVPKFHHLQTLSAVDSPAFICVTESWLHPEISDTDIGLPGYQLHQADRSSTLGSVCVIYSRNDISVTPVDNPAIQLFSD